MDKKIVFFDIDGTVWDWKGIIPDSTKEAIARLIANGHLPIICSGRARAHLKNKELHSLGFPGVIAACGTHVEYEGRILYERFLDEAVIKEIIRLSKEYNVPIVLEGPDKHWLTKQQFCKDEFVDRMLAEMGEDILWLDEYSDDMKVNKFAGDILISSNFGPFKEYVEGKLTLIEHSNGWTSPAEHEAEDYDIIGIFEAVPIGSSKADGIRRFCEYIGSDPKDAYAFGDSMNDLEMLKIVGTGIAMGDGAEELKAQADYVTDGVWADGISNALRHFGLI